MKHSRKTITRLFTALHQRGCPIGMSIEYTWVTNFNTYFWYPLDNADGDHFMCRPQCDSMSLVTTHPKKIKARQHVSIGYGTSRR